MKYYREILVFVAHAFQPKNRAYELGEFRKAISELFEEVTTTLQREYLGFKLKPIVDMNDYDRRLPTNIEEQLKNCNFAIIDISDNNPNVLFELGQLSARNKPYIIIKSSRSRTDYPIPADITDRLVCFYDEITDIKRLLLDTIMLNFRRILSQPALSSKYLEHIWFPDDRRELQIICGPELEKSPFATRKSENYIFLDNLEDKDALLETLMFLSRSLPRTRMIRYASDNFPPGHIEGDLIIIGGPGEPDGPGNILCTQMMSRIKSKSQYSDDCETLTVDGRDYRADLDKHGYITQDYGYFARFPNPFNSHSSVVLINGLHTYGTLGAALAFTDHPNAQLNIRTVVDKLDFKGVGRLAFECFFKVEIVSNAVTCPLVEAADIVPLEIPV